MEEISPTDHGAVGDIFAYTWGSNRKRIRKKDGIGAENVEAKYC